MIGSRLGPYEITAKLGEGGMGEVYRAYDSKLKRDVAIKVLPAVFTQDAERLARFEREAQVLAQLNHPNIAQIYGLEASGESHALVMELVEGPTLADRLAQGALPLDESLLFARQIAEALEEAHEKGIVHRDLKPQNIKASSEGRIKVLDFGLAKAMDPASASSLSPGDLARSPTLLNSPTLTAAGGTQLGVILGTAAYMAPEQARGVAVDKRADIWAFGVILWEMLAGRPLFAGDSVSDVLAAVLRQEVDVDALPSGTPPAIRRLVRRCLARKSRERLHAIADARIVLDEAIAGVPEAPETAPGTVPPVTAPGRRRGWIALPWILTAIFGTQLLLKIVKSPGGDEGGASASPVVADLGAPVGQKFHFQGDFGAPPVLSPDGEQVVFGAVGDQGTTRLWLRSLATGEERGLEGTEGGFAPFFSPDGSQIGFFAGDKLKTVSTRGGSPLTVADAPNGRGGAWFPDGSIVFSPGFRAGLVRVRAAGGTPATLTTLDTQRHSSHRWPSPTPDGRALVYLATSHTWAEQDQNELRWIRLDGTGDHALLPSAANGVASGGELFHYRESTLFAQPFDAATGALSGEARVVAQGVLYDQSTWRASYSVAGGRLLYSPAGASTGSHLSRVDRTGKVLDELAPEGPYFDLSISPDGRRVVVTRDAPSDLWLLDLDRHTFRRFTFEVDDESSGIWSPNGRWIYYVANDDQNRQRIFRRSPDGGGSAERIYEADPGIDLTLHQISPDGRWLLVRSGDFPYYRHAVLGLLDLGSDRKLVPLVEGPQLANSSGRFSPDGRWLTYWGTESGTAQVYVRSAEPGGSSRWQISTDGGFFPLWSADGTEIVYLEPSLNLSRVAVTADGAGSLRFAPPESLFGTSLLADQQAFALAPDGQSLILNHFGEAQSRPLRMILDWRRLLASRGPGPGR